MWIKTLKINNFRNYSSLELNFEKGINYIQGDNGSGKTSLVEAIAFLPYFKSFRTSEEKDAIKEKEEFFRIAADTSKGKFVYVLSEKGKYIELDDIELKKVSEIAGIINVVSFIPKDVELFKDIPLKRRRFLDINLSILDKNYLNLLSEYNSYLNNIRNLLKSEKVDELTLNILIEGLGERGFVLQQKRIEFIKRLNQELLKVGRYLNGDEVELSIKYRQTNNQLEKKKYIDFIKEQVINSLKNKTGKIQIPGIHSDDFTLYYNKRNIAIYGSQGQNRISVISLKLSLFSLIKEKFKQEPIVILDDVLSELDENHQKKLVKLLNRIEQVFVTGTKNELKENFTLYNVENNNVRRI